MDKKILIVPILVIIFISGCIESNSQTELKAVFDMSHGEIFPPYGETKNSYSILYAQFLKNDFDTDFNEKPITQEVLSNVKVLVFAGPMKKIETQEINAITNFVQNGGNLLILTHIYSPLTGLMQEFNITISGSVTLESENLVNSSPQNFFVKDFENHTITEGLKQIAVFGSWSIISNEPARTVAWTSKTSWSEVKKNMIFDKDFEKHERLGIVSTLQYGKGKVVVIADDAIFIDQFMDIADNRKLGQNIILWFKE